MFWKNIKVSIAGAKLSHLVQNDRIWDYGSMIEQVKMVFMQIEKAKKKEQPEVLRKYMTITGYELFKIRSASESKTIENVLEKVAIIDVHARSKHLPDRFCALVNGIKNHLNNSADFLNSYKITEKFSEQWLFLRQGDWWMLDKMKV